MIPLLIIDVDISNQPVHVYYDMEAHDYLLFVTILSIISFLVKRVH